MVGLFVNKYPRREFAKIGLMWEGYSSTIWVKRFQLGVER